MITRRLQSLRARLNSLYTVAGKQQDIVVQSQLARYLCILTLGLVEQSMQTFGSQYAEHHSRVEVSAYVSQAVSYVQNPNFERVRQFCAAFDDKWREQFEARVSEDQKVALNSVWSIRNTLAHGEDYALSLGVMRDYYDRILKLLDILEDVFEP